MYSIKNLQYLVAVANEKSFSKAALSCNVTQSTLSLGIQELERQMNLTLLERSRKIILPTTAGVKAIARAREILRQSQFLVDEMHSIKSPNAGPLRIGAIPTIAPYFLPQFLPVLETSFPNSNIQISEDTTETILAKIHEGKMDVGIIALPMNIGELESYILFEEHFVVATHKNTTMPKTIHIDDIMKYDLLLLRDGHCLKDHVLSACKLPPEKQNKFFEAESLQTLLAMVNQGYGVTLLPNMAIKADIIASYPNVKIHLFKNPPPTRHIGLVWRRSDLRRHDFLGIKIK